MCKHVAAVLYGVGARFDEDPALFFLLRQVNSEDLIAAAAGADGLVAAAPAGAGALAGADLGSVFAIDLDDGSDAAVAAPAPPPAPASAKRRPPRVRAAKESEPPCANRTTKASAKSSVPASKSRRTCWSGSECRARHSATG